MTTSLANLDFGEQSITIYGTQNDPLIKCSDLLIHVLGYKDCSKANWYPQLCQDIDLVTPVIHGDGENVTMVNHQGVAATQQVGESSRSRMFTEMGIYTALMKSNKPIAKQF